jgi:hypothetical protein
MASSSLSLGAGTMWFEARRDLKGHACRRHLHGEGAAWLIPRVCCIYLRHTKSNKHAG